MSEEKKVHNNNVQEEKADNFNVDECEKYDHSRGPFKYRMYIAKDVPVQEKYEAMIDYMLHFRALYYKQIKDNIEALKNQENKAE